MNRWANGLRRYGGDGDEDASRWPDRSAVPKRSRRLLWNGDDANGGAGIPVNSWTMARKLVVSVVSTVVGALRDALDLFFWFRAGALAFPAPLPLLSPADGGPAAACPCTAFEPS